MLFLNLWGLSLAFWARGDLKVHVLATVTATTICFTIEGMAIAITLGDSPELVILMPLVSLVADYLDLTSVSWVTW